MALTDEQMTFLNHSPSEHARLLAGPGTGKSYTSVEYLKKVMADNPELRVGYITFTRAATAEFLVKVTEGELNVKPKTMHGFSLGILLKNKASGIPYPLRILDAWESKNIVWPDITARLRAKGFDKVTPKIVRALESEMAAGYESLDSARLPLAKEFPELVNAYKGIWSEHRRQYGYTLLSELPYHAGLVLEDINQGEAGLDLLIVDEYQDLNHADQKVLIELSKQGVSIIAIGDDDQSIYSWRNAAPDGIRNFLDTYKTTYDYPLTISMRCGGDALEAAANLIELDPDRKLKKRLTASKKAKSTEFHYLKFRSNVGEARGVARVVASRIQQGVSPADIAILVRSSIPVWTKSLFEELDKAGIPIGQSLDIDSVFSQPQVRKTIAMAQLLVNQHDSISWRALVKITPSLGDVFIANILNNEHEGSFAAKLNQEFLEGFENQTRHKESAIKLCSTVYDWIHSIDLGEVELGEYGWGAWLIEQIEADKFPQDAKQFFLDVGKQVGNDKPLTRFLTELAPLAKDLSSGSSEGVRIMSMAKSKGLTVNTAIVMGVEAGRMPAPMGQEDEELRLLYVALTRATDMTVVTYANTRTGQTARLGSNRVMMQQEQSPFMRHLTGVSLEDGDEYLQAQT
jgi:DNA helicase-2/ATP-dependent DNA helicase PcrA